MQTKKLTEELRHELIEYAFNVVYLTLVFAALWALSRRGSYAASLRPPPNSTTTSSPSYNASKFSGSTAPSSTRCMRA
jgi:hypothetical protein